MKKKASFQHGTNKILVALRRNTSEWHARAHAHGQDVSFLLLRGLQIC